MSNELLKKAGIGLLALLVVCNTVRIHGMKKHSSKAREAFSGMRARMGEARKMQRPELGQRRGMEKGQESKRGKRQKQDAK
tara:strand:+ start:382 stop:624 length:243 start_codon:yes stop_codon:yes gene_type:complete